MDLGNSRRVFDPESSFFSLKVVWLTSGFVFLSALSCYLLILLNEDLVFDFSSNGFNYAVQVFRVPLALLALLIPLVALLAGNHRSEQTVHQMHILQQQNTFQNYNKHREEFRSHCSTMAKAGQGKFKLPDEVYSQIFDQSKYGNLEPNQTIVENICNFGKKIYWTINIGQSGPSPDFYSKFPLLQSAAKSFLSEFDCRPGKWSVPRRVFIDGEESRVLGSKPVESISIYISLFKLLYKACFFFEIPPKPVRTLYENLTQAELEPIVDYDYEGEPSLVDIYPPQP